MRVISGQSLSDIAVQEDGNIETVFEWALKRQIDNGKTCAWRTIGKPKQRAKRQTVIGIF